MSPKTPSEEREYHTKQMHAYRKEWKASGMCAWCPKRAEPGHVLCPDCARKNVLRSAQRRARAKGQPVPTSVDRKPSMYIVRKPDESKKHPC